MKTLLHQCLLLFLVFLPAAGSLAAEAPLVLLPTPGPQHVFGGGKRALPFQWRNPGEKLATVEIHCALFQASSTTAMPVGRVPWKTLSVLPGQTVLESALVELPAVRAETGCVLKWVDTNNTVLGTTKLRVYPTNLLHELEAVAPVGIYDPGNLLKPIFKAGELEFVDLQETESFTGKLVIALPVGAEPDAAARLKTRLKAFAREGVAVVFFRVVDPQPNEIPMPSYYLVRDGRGAIVVAPASAISNLANDPLAQLQLLHFSRFALRPETMPVPEL